MSSATSAGARRRWRRSSCILACSATTARWTAVGSNRGAQIAGRTNADVAARVVLLHDYESLWAYDAQPHHAGISYWRQMMLFYSALRELGVDLDIRHPDHDLSGYDVIVAPALQIMDAARAATLCGQQRTHFSWPGRAPPIAHPRAVCMRMASPGHCGSCWAAPCAMLIRCDPVCIVVPQAIRCRSGQRVTLCRVECTHPLRRWAAGW